jgi:hypothetical protein
MDNIHIWTTVHYGDTPEEMANAIVKEWLRAGRDPDVGGPWFAIEHIYEAKRASDAPERTRDSLS